MFQGRKILTLIVRDIQNSFQYYIKPFAKRHRKIRKFHIKFDGIFQYVIQFPTPTYYHPCPKTGINSKF